MPRRIPGLSAGSMESRAGVCDCLHRGFGGRLVHFTDIVGEGYRNLDNGHAVVFTF